MKKLAYNSLLILLLMGLNSCNDFLKEEPRSQISVDQFYLTPADAISAVNNLYRTGFPSFYDAGSAYMGPTVMYGGYISGLFDNQYKGQEKFVQDSQNLAIDPVVNNSSLLAIWQNCYSAIGRANNTLKYLPTTPGLTPAEFNQYTAEIRFFRALNYFHLVKMFGGVPLITEPSESIDNLYFPKSTEAEIYNFIVEDLEFGVDSGGLPDLPMQRNSYRISKGSVSALLADVYLNMSGFPLNDNKYAEAAAVAKSLITNGAYGLIQNGATPEQSAYNTLRTSDDEDEYLYVIEYDPTISDGGWRPVYSFPNEAATWGEFTYNITDNAYRPVTQILAAYDNTNDLRAQEKQYFHTNYTFTKGDRMGETVQFADVTPYFWFEPEALYETNQSQKDQVHYRLAEMYLIAAEAIAQTSGVNAEAADYLATIKARASLNQTKAQITAELMALSKDQFIQEVWAEKIRELIFENKIWNDITRTRMYPTVVNGAFTFVPFVGAQNPWGHTFTEKNLLLPIPDDEIQRNPELVQNTGY
ncbi:MAG TPA: RagB/SusD family nutrient uptake outer membrane protein [Prolixibacteraceae bacterium]|nr:RagB/SusD family nutrient uptake outer membrane protein [Prolixibacteraceae bacterium]